MTPVRLRVPALLLALAAPALAACTDGASSGSADSTVIQVESSDDACTLSATEFPAGSVTFQVENTGGEETEFYLYAADGEEIIGEVEDIGPGLSRDLSVDAPAGSYVAACKPGMTGDGIRVEVTATD